MEGPAAPAPDIRGGQILHAQVDGLQTTGIISQFNETATQFDTELADDFMVPEGDVWLITSMYVRGFFSSPVQGVPANLTNCPEANVFFWNDDDGGPGEMVAERTFSPDDGPGGEMTANFSEVVLSEGHYWVSYVCFGPGLDSGVEDRWNWFVNAADTNWEPAHIRNEGGGFNIGTDWNSFTGFNFPGTDLDFYLAGNLGTSSEGGAQPMPFSLLQNSPNPFVGTTDIRFQLDEAADITLTVYDALGRQVSQTAAGMLPAGEQSLTFDAGTLPPGTYFYRVQSGEQMMVRKMTVLN